MDKDIDNTILSCKLCQDSVPSQQKEPITLKPTPQRPFQEITAYFCSHAGQQYLITVHCFSDWLEITPMMTNTTTRKLVSALKLSFCCTGAPDKVWADQGPQFTSQAFRKFAKQWGFEYVTSTPRYPQSNGKAKATVKSMKKIIRSAWRGWSLDKNKLAQALLQYCNTPSPKNCMDDQYKTPCQPIDEHFHQNDNTAHPWLRKKPKAPWRML